MYHSFWTDIFDILLLPRCYLCGKLFFSPIVKRKILVRLARFMRTFNDARKMPVPNAMILRSKFMSLHTKCHYSWNCRFEVQFRFKCLFKKFIPEYKYKVQNISKHIHLAISESSHSTSAYFKLRNDNCIHCIK